MTVFIKVPDRKVVVIGWNQAQGQTVDIEVNHEGALETIKDVKNTGSTNLYFPANYTGSVEVTVQGSKPGSDPDKGTLSIS